MKGGPGLVPGQPPVPDITSSSNVGAWTEGQFMQVLRTGKTPSGHQMKSEDMPWTMTAKYSDKELGALHTFLRSKQLAPCIDWFPFPLPAAGIAVDTPQRSEE
jgi:hypothetical protein